MDHNYHKWPKNYARIYALLLTEKAVPQTFSLLECMEEGSFRLNRVLRIKINKDKDNDKNNISSENTNLTISHFNVDFFLPQVYIEELVPNFLKAAFFNSFLPSGMLVFLRMAVGAPCFLQSFLAMTSWAARSFSRVGGRVGPRHFPTTAKDGR